MEPVERWLVIWLVNNGCLTAHPDEESSLDAAVQLWIDTGRDTILRLRDEQVTAPDLCYLASQVVGWRISIPVTRERVSRSVQARGAAVIPSRCWVAI